MILDSKLVSQIPLPAAAFHRISFMTYDELKCFDSNMIGGSYIAEHGNWPIFSTEFGKIVSYVSGLRKTGILLDTEILYFEGWSTAKFQSYGH